MSVTESPNNQSATGFSRLVNDYWVNKFTGIEELQLPKDPLKSSTERKDDKASTDIAIQSPWSKLGLVIRLLVHYGGETLRVFGDVSC